jgi:uncharacterized membrane protein
MNDRIVELFLNGKLTVGQAAWYLRFFGWLQSGSVLLWVSFLSGWPVFMSLFASMFMGVALPPPVVRAMFGLMLVALGTILWRINLRRD